MVCGRTILALRALRLTHPEITEHDDYMVRSIYLGEESVAEANKCGLKLAPMQMHWWMSCRVAIGNSEEVIQQWRDLGCPKIQAEGPKTQSPVRCWGW
jgi:hypothetical protein